MTSDSIRLPDVFVPSLAHYLLRQEIPALQLIATDHGQARWGPLIRLPKGAELQEFGKGFDDQTLLVRFGQCFYIVFQEDLAQSQKLLKHRTQAAAAGSN